jgi:hypothetical protein
VFGIGGPRPGGWPAGVVEFPLRGNWGGRKLPGVEGGDDEGTRNMVEGSSAGSGGEGEGRKGRRGSARRMAVASAVAIAVAVAKQLSRRMDATSSDALAWQASTNQPASQPTNQPTIQASSRPDIIHEWTDGCMGMDTATGLLSSARRCHACANAAPLGDERSQAKGSIILLAQLDISCLALPGPYNNQHQHLHLIKR